MSYEKQNLADGDVLSAEHIDHIEDGILAALKAAEDAGADAYELAVANGFKGTLEEWLASLEGEDGNGIVGIAKTDGTGEPGTKDTYTIYFSDGRTFPFSVYNGKDAGAGAVYATNEECVALLAD